MLDAGDFTEARDAFRRLAKIDAAQADAHYGLARALRGLADEAAANQALVDYMAALAAAQTKANGLETAVNLTRSTAAVFDLLSAGRVDEARVQLGRVLAVDATFDLVPLARAAVALRSGEDAEADLDAIITLVKSANPKLGEPQR